MVSIPTKPPKVQFKVGVTSGLWMGGQVPDTATIVRKLGYGLTRGTDVIEIALNVPHEITYTDGQELRYIAKSQGLELTLHGSLTIPMAIPERAEWRDAHNHIIKSIQSAVFGGCSYVNFHSCLNFWLEMMTYAGRKLTMTFCDHEGNFISKILKENEKLRKWFIRERWADYYRDILDEEEQAELGTKIRLELEAWRIREIKSKIIPKIEPILRKDPRIPTENIPRILEETSDYIQRFETLHPTVAAILPEEMKKSIENEIKQLRERSGKKHAELVKDVTCKVIEEKFLQWPKKKWASEELRAIVGVIDGYLIMAHHLYYSQDEIWKEMEKMYEELMKRYKKLIKEKYGIDYGHEDWLDKALMEAEENNDREFKEFFYAVCAAKFLEGHITKAVEWIEKEFIPFLEKSNYKDKDELIGYAKKLKIVIEPPDARDPRYGGLYLIFRPKQIYVAIKVLKEVDKIDRVYMLIDFEHIATQGLDPLEEIREFAKLVPDAGKYILSFHVTPPTPLHPHVPIEIGDRENIYKILWELRKTGLGKFHTCLLYTSPSPRD